MLESVVQRAEREGEGEAQARLPARYGNGAGFRMRPKTGRRT